MRNYGLLLNLLLGGVCWNFSGEMGRRELMRFLFTSLCLCLLELGVLPEMLSVDGAFEI